ncbi:MAG: Ig-like domain-containing protein, partial [Petrotogales bacterium]
NISYGWDWDGDLIVDEWTDWYESNETCNTSHFWWEPGEYNISVIANNTMGNVSTWSAPLNVTMLNHPPYEPSNPNPSDGAPDVDIDEILNWTGGDPDSCDTVTYDVYFGTVIPPPKVSSNQTVTSYDPGVLNFSTTYYWMIVAWDNHSASTEGAMWRFTTRTNTPPYEPSNPDPEDGAKDVSIDASLSWTGGDPDGDPVTFDVYFGDRSPPPQVASNTSDTYKPETMNYSTTYFWKITAWDNHGASTEGAMWNFTTEASTSPEVTITRPLKGSFYLRNRRIPLLINTIIYGPIDINISVKSEAKIEKVELEINGKLKNTITEEPYTYRWAPLLCGRYTIKATAYDEAGQKGSHEIKVFKWRAHPVLLLAATPFMLKYIKAPFKLALLRGTVFNCKRVGTEFHARAIRLHFIEFTGFTRTSGVIKLRKVSFQHSPFIRTYDIGPLGLTTYIFGFVPGGLS